MNQNQQTTTDNAADNDVGRAPLNKLQLVALLTKVQQQIEAGEVVAFVMLAAAGLKDEADENRVIHVVQASGDPAIEREWFAEPLLRVALTLGMGAPAGDESDETDETEEERAAA